jgi:TPP-dependent pyruvate/acetoin dehydrogenase alpha subunit
VSLAEADRALAALAPAPFHLPVSGLEAVVEGALAGLEAEDWWVPGLRERVGATLRGVPVDRLVDPRRGARPYKVAPVDGSPANRALVAVGLALGAGGVALVHLGIGSVSDGAFTEALNLAKLRQARVIFLVAVHPLSGEAPLPAQTAASPSKLAEAYGVPTAQVNGRSRTAVREAVTAARAAGGPVLIEASL